MAYTPNLPAARNIVLGAGYIYFDEFDANGNPTGERYLAETEGFTLGIKTESLEYMSNDGPISEKILDVAKSVSREFGVTLVNVDDVTLPIFLIGSVTTLTTTAGALTGQTVNGGNGVLQGRHYQLGLSAGLPSGVREVTGVAVNNGGTTYVAGTDYEVDLALARVYILPGGGIADDTVVTADFTTTNASWAQVTSNDLGAKRGALRYVADNTAGENRDLYAPYVVMKPNGDLAFKSRDKVQQMGFSVSCQAAPDGRAAVYLNGRPV